MNSYTVQIEELVVLESIYGDDFKFENDCARSFSISLKEGSRDASLYVTLVDTYPTSTPPKFMLSIPWLKGKKKAQLSTDLHTIYNENKGEFVVYKWVEYIREFLINDSTDSKTMSNSNEDTSADDVDSKDAKPDVEKESESYDNLHYNIAEMKIKEKEENKVYEIFSGNNITDRKSTFQPHLAVVSSKEDVKGVLDQIKENRKIKEATHNIYAYRYKSPRGIVQDCDDDGEGSAGKKILFILETTDSMDVIVIVSRWFGGIKLGHDRFRHINNAARQILDVCGYLPKKQELVKKKKKHS